MLRVLASQDADGRANQQRSGSKEEETTDEHGFLMRAIPVFKTAVVQFLGR